MRVTSSNLREQVKRQQEGPLASAFFSWRAAEKTESRCWSLESQAGSAAQRPLGTARPLGDGSYRHRHLDFMPAF